MRSVQYAGVECKGDCAATGDDDEVGAGCERVFLFHPTTVSLTLSI